MSESITQPSPPPLFTMLSLKTSLRLSIVNFLRLTISIVNKGGGEDLAGQINLFEALGGLWATQINMNREIKCNTKIPTSLMEIWLLVELTSSAYFLAMLNCSFSRSRPNT